MSRFAWSPVRRVSFKGMEVPCALSLDIRLDGSTFFGQSSGVRIDGPRRLAIKRALTPFRGLVQHSIGPGFITREVGRLLQPHLSPTSDFLEIGCGSMLLRRYLPKGCTYNAIEMSISEFVLETAVRNNPAVNFAFALATDIPLPNSSVDTIASAEVFEHIPPIADAMKEVRRVLRTGGHLVCSIPNNYYYKYQVVGENSDHVNKWHFDEFAKWVVPFGFEVVEAHRKGCWVPCKLPGLQNLYLPFRPKQEFYTSNFFFTFRAVS